MIFGYNINRVSFSHIKSLEIPSDCSGGSLFFACLGGGVELALWSGFGKVN